MISRATPSFNVCVTSRRGMPGWRWGAAFCWVVTSAYLDMLALISSIELRSILLTSEFCWCPLTCDTSSPETWGSSDHLDFTRASDGRDRSERLQWSQSSWSSESPPGRWKTRKQFLLWMKLHLAVVATRWNFIHSKKKPITGITARLEENKKCKTFG